MQNKKAFFLVLSVSVITAATAIYYLSPSHVRGLWWTFTSLLRGQTWPGFAWWALILVIISELLIFLKIVAAYGLFLIRPWARNFAIVVLSVDLLTKLYGIANFWIYYLQHPEPFPIPIERGGVFVEYVSMWPTYIVAILSLISIIILFQKPVRSIFSRENN